MLIVTGGGLPALQALPVSARDGALVHLREHTILAKIAAGFGASESTGHAHNSAVIRLLAQRAPGLLKVCARPTPTSSCWTAPSPSATGAATHARTTPTSTAGTE